MTVAQQMKPSKGSTLSFAKAVRAIGGEMLPRTCTGEELELQGGGGFGRAYSSGCGTQLATLPADKGQGFTVICFRCDKAFDFPKIAKARG